MPRITRKQQKVFAVNATNNGVFGSLQANDPTHSQDPDVIQSRTAYSNGWDDATYSAEKLPPLEEFQGLQYLFSRQIAYLMQEGIPEWDTNTTYYKGSLVKAIQNDGSFILYASLVDNNAGNLVTDTTKWVITNTSTNFHQGIPNWRADVIYSDGDWVKQEIDGKWTIFESLQNNNLNNQVTDTDYWQTKPFGLGLPLFSHCWYDYEINDQSWVRSDTFSWQDGSFYEDAYDHLVDDIDGITSTTETVGSYTVTYYQATDGHKIVLPDQETTVANIYAESGVAWYYILDTTNQRFKLPRTKYGFTGLRDGVGNYVEAGLPDHNHTVNCNFTRWGSGATSAYGWGAGDGGGWTVTPYDVTNASSSNPIYGNSNTVQPPATQMYLYFYVGQFTQTATEQTAGLNASLFNGKVDLDGSNATFKHIVETYSNGTNWYRKWSDGWIEQGGRVTTGSWAGSESLLVPYNDTNWSVFITVSRNNFGGTADGYNYFGTAEPGSNSGFNWATVGHGGTQAFHPFQWYACGYKV